MLMTRLLVRNLGKPTEQDLEKVIELSPWTIHNLKCYLKHRYSPLKKSRPINAPASGITTYTDTLGTGWGLAAPTTEVSGTLEGWDIQFWSNFKETKTIFLTSNKSKEDLNEKKVRIIFTNTPAISYINNKGETPSIKLYKLARKKFGFSWSCGMDLVASQVPGRLNKVVYGLSCQ